MIQTALPLVPISTHEVARKRTLGAAIELCAEAAGLEPKALQADLKIDKAQWSRWTHGEEGIKWDRLHALMLACGNFAPVLWMADRCGYDISAMRPIESELERQNRQLREENAALRRVLAGGR